MGILGSIHQHKPGKIVFFDTETTDLRPGEIAQLSYVVTDEALQIVTAKNFYFAVAEVAAGASKVNGLTEEKCLILSGGKRFADHYMEIHGDFHDQNLVAHNINFDLNFMRSEFTRMGASFNPGNQLCTMRYFTDICCLPGKQSQYKFPKLAEVCSHYGIREEEVGDQAIEMFGMFNGSFHDSRFDVAALYLMCKRAHEQEQEFMQEIG